MQMAGNHPALPAHERFVSAVCLPLIIKYFSGIFLAAFHIVPGSQTAKFHRFDP